MKNGILAGLVLLLIAAAFLLGYTHGYETATAAIPSVVVCDSTEPQPITDPRDPFLRYVVPNCTLGNVYGGRVDVHFID